MHIAYCNKVTKVTNPISDFTFLSTAKSGKSRINNPFLDSLKGTHPKTLVCLCIFYKRFWLKNKSTILFTNHFYLG